MRRQRSKRLSFKGGGDGNVDWMAISMTASSIDDIVVGAATVRMTLRRSGGPACRDRAAYISTYQPQ